MPRVPFRWWLALAMTAMFLVSLARAEMRWAACNAEDAEICFAFPIYLPYEVHQGLSLHGIALFPAAVAHSLPGSISGERSLPWLRIAATAISVFVTWWLIGVWWERLRSGFSMPTWARWILWPVVGLVGPAICFGVALGIRGGWHGATNTTAGFVMPILLIATALVDLGVLQRIWRSLIFGALVSTMLSGLAMWTEREINFNAEAEAARCAGGAFCLDSGFDGPLYLLDATMLSVPATLASMGITPLAPEAFRYQIRVFMGWLYWFLLHALATGRWPASNALYRAIRPILRVPVWGIFVLTMIGWLFWAPNHGPNGSFGAAVGFGLAALALRKPTP